MKKNYLLSILTILTANTSIMAFQSNQGKSDDTLNKIYNSKFFSIYKKILQPKCALAGCHDGNFEPDFRTIQSSYYTLINQIIIKNNRKNLFTYRVVPQDTFASVLYQRITKSYFVDSNDRMPFADKNGLPKESIQLIADWIMEGAPNILGELPPLHYYVSHDIEGQYDMKGFKDRKMIAIDRSKTKLIDDFLGSTIIRSDFDSIQLTFYINMNAHTDENYIPMWEFSISTSPNYSPTVFSGILKKNRDALKITIPINRLPHEQHLFFRIIDQKDPENKMPVDWALFLTRNDWSIYISNVNNK